MGTSTYAMTVATDDHTARLTGSSTKRRNARIPANAMRSTAVVVRRGSQSHHTPHVGFAQIAPWQQRRNARSTPTSMEASSLASHLQSFVKRKRTAAAKAKVIASIAFHAVGTCTYMMRGTSPMKCPGGATNRQRYEPVRRQSTPKPIRA